MVRLTDEELSLLEAPSRPLNPDARPQFMATVAAELEAKGQSGIGLVHQIARTAQRKFFTPPEIPNLKGMPQHRGPKTVSV